MKILMPIYGTRPEAIKMAPIVSAIRLSPLFDCVVTVTGQHRDMLDQVNQVFGIVPDYDLNIMLANQTLNGVLVRTIEGLDKLFRDIKPDAVIVQGDTTTSTGAAIAAFHWGIPVVHAEAGLRSFNIQSPFPEEANRKITSQISSLHLAPTATSRDNLLAEQVNPANVVVTGNTVIDALMLAEKKSVQFNDIRLEALTRRPEKVILVTTHRRENHGKIMDGIGRALAQVADSEPGVVIVIPIHKNPAVRETLVPHLAGRANIIVTEPLRYLEFIRMISISHFIITDSGGVQEEAPSLGKPVLVLRDNTERPEAVEAGTVRLVGVSKDRIVKEVKDLIHNTSHFNTMANAINPYGDGNAADRSIAAIAELLGVGKRINEFQASGAAVSG